MTRYYVLRCGQKVEGAARKQKQDLSNSYLKGGGTASYTSPCSSWDAASCVSSECLYNNRLFLARRLGEKGSCALARYLVGLLTELTYRPTGKLAGFRPLES